MFNLLIVLSVALSVTSGFAQIKNPKTETVKIFGNCDMCKTAIENAGNLKNIASVNWNNDSKMAEITFDSKKTNRDEILKRIALAGYDSEEFLAPDTAYAQLAGCCKYERLKKEPVIAMDNTKMQMDMSESKMDSPVEQEGKTMPSSEKHANMTMPSSEKHTDMKMPSTENHKDMKMSSTEKHTDMKMPTAEKHTDMKMPSTEEHTDMPMSGMKETNPLDALFNNYFAVKDALVKTNPTTAAAKSSELLTALKALKIESLKAEVQTAVTKAMPSLMEAAKNISATKDIGKQRETFKVLSKNMHELIPFYNANETLYYQYCPMQDANWLSKDKTVKNPYYGSQMLSCGSTVETIDAKN